MNANDARTCALAAALFDDDRAGELARHLVLDYANIYLSYPPTGRIASSWGRVTASALDEAVWALGILAATELLFKSGRLSEEELARCRTKVFEPVVDLLWGEWSAIHNIRSWVNAIVGCIGLAFGDRAAVREAVHGQYGLREQLAKGFVADGLSSEGSPGYHAYGVSAILFLAESMIRNGYMPYGDGKIQALLMVPLRMLQPNGTVPGLNDYASDTMFPTRLYGTALRRMDGPAIRAAAGFAFHVWRNNSFGPDDRFGQHHRIWSSTPAYYLRQQVDWFLAWDRIEIQTQPKLAQVVAMPESGIGITRSGGDNYTLLKCGGALSRSHDHYDRLHLIWWHEGMCWLTDAGSGHYTDSMHARWFVLTLAHNTVLVDYALHERCRGELEQCTEHQLAGSIRPYPQTMPDVKMHRNVTLSEAALRDRFTVQSDHPRLADYVLRPAGKLVLPAHAQASPYGPLCEMSSSRRTDLVGLGYDVPQRVRLVRFDSRNGSQRVLTWLQHDRVLRVDLSALPDACEVLIARVPQAPGNKHQHSDMLLLRQHGDDVTFSVTLNASRRTRLLDAVPRLPMKAPIAREHQPLAKAVTEDYVIADNA